MRAVVQRVSSAEVTVEGDRTGAIGIGLLVLAGIAQTDTSADADALADKIVGLRIFADEKEKMNRSVSDVGGAVLLVSQFTLLGDVRKGRRPSFTAAAPPEEAEILMARLAGAIQSYGLTVEHGQFGAMMDVTLTNDGPVTIVIDTLGGKVV